MNEVFLRRGNQRTSYMPKSVVGAEEPGQELIIDLWCNLIRTALPIVKQVRCKP